MGYIVALAFDVYGMMHGSIFLKSFYFYFSSHHSLESPLDLEKILILKPKVRGVLKKIHKLEGFSNNTQVRGVLKRYTRS